MTDGVVALARTLDQELVAPARGVSLACPVCSEFVMHVRGAHGLAIACPECKMEQFRSFHEMLETSTIKSSARTYFPADRGARPMPLSPFAPQSTVQADSIPNLVGIAKTKPMQEEPPIR